MNATTIPRRSPYELLSSMRFAISLLTVIAIAAVIGTVLKQNEPYTNYINQFGPFWFPIFERLGLYSVYNATWFLTILAFLVASTSVCVWKNTPKMLREMRAWRDSLQERSLRNFGHRAEFTVKHDTKTVLEATTGYLRGAGFAMREKALADGTLIAAKAGTLRRLGYVFAHTGIVVICVGGLADSDLPIRMQLASGEKQLLTGNIQPDAIPPAGLLGRDSWSFRGNMLVPEGGTGAFVVVNVRDGALIQDIPFTIELKRFQIEHYSTGAPKLFLSEIVVTDKDTGKSFEHRIEVNKPLTYRGITVYQASFDDGGTQLNLRGLNLHKGQAQALPISGRIGEQAKIAYAGSEYTLELTGFRPTNVENVATGDDDDIGPRSLLGGLREHLGSGARAPDKKEFRNVGPSFLYRLRDASGQAREYHNYMLPVMIEGRWFYLSGMRETPSEPFRFLRMPLDEDASFDSYLAMREVMLDASQFAAIGKRFANTSGTAMGDAAMRERLEDTAIRVLETFSTKGIQSVAEFLEKAVPEGEREKAADIYLRLLQGVAWESLQYSRERAGLKALEPTAERARFVQDALNAMSDSFFYGVPLYFQLLNYDEVKASVFQLTRAPAKNIVYLGCLLLVLGVFAMLYVRERRLWVLVKPGGSVLMAMSSNRKSYDFEREFERHRTALAKLAE